MTERITKSAKETRKAGEVVVKKITNGKSDKAVVVGLRGELGSGKTTFVQGMAEGLQIKDRITSPTFVIMKRYKGVVGKNRRVFLYHIDCYRITDSDDLLELGWDEILQSPQNIVVVEWAERIKKIMPPNAIRLNFQHSENKNMRGITTL